MVFRKQNKEMDYELVDQSDQHLTRPPRWEDNELSCDTHSDARSSTDSVSDYFEDIEAYTVRNGMDDNDNFNTNSKFYKVWSNYTGNTGFSIRTISIFGGILTALWLTSLIVYAHLAGNPVQFAKTDITKTQWMNGTLNEYSVTAKNITLHDYLTGQYLPNKQPIQWLTKKQYPKSHKSNSKGGFYLVKNADNKMILKQVNSDVEEIFMKDTRFAYGNTFVNIQDIIVNPAKPIDQINDNWHIVVTDSVNQWRRSSFALFWIYVPQLNDYFLIQEPSSNDNTKDIDPRKLYKLSFVEFAPDGEKAIFGLNNNLYLITMKDRKVEQITKDGSDKIFNGKTDWVYEEEVTNTDRLIWWSPDSLKLIYAKINDTEVPEFELEYHIKQSSEVSVSYEAPTNEQVQDVNQYPILKKIPYPKPGTKIPVVELYQFIIDGSHNTKLQIPQQSLLNNTILYHGQWISEKSFLFKMTDRTSRWLNKYILEDGVVKFINEVDALTKFDGWFEKMQQLTLIRDEVNQIGYIDKVVEGKRTHLAYFDDATRDSPQILTPKDVSWEVIFDTPVVYRYSNNCIYFLITGKTGMDTELVSMNLGNQEIKYLTSSKEQGKYQINFSEDGEFLDLTYDGPRNSLQRLIDMADWDEFNEQEESNSREFISQQNCINSPEAYSAKMHQFNLPTRFYKEVTLDSLQLNIVEIIPPNFSPKKKYPLLVYAYGGPGSQSASKDTATSFQDIVSAKLDAVVLIIDPRGTGPTWKSRSYANRKLGYWEPRDITTITKEYLESNKFIDSQRTAIWGWSYGAFTTLKTIEYDKGGVFKYGIAVAPVTNWMFYDSVYTERYMSLPSLNENYQKISRINDFEAFGQVKRFLLMHGTSDDNVHIQNSYWFLDKLNEKGIENYDSQFFPDSDHSISYHSATIIVYEKLLHWLEDSFTGKFDNLLK